MNNKLNKLKQSLGMVSGLAIILLIFIYLNNYTVESIIIALTIPTFFLGLYYFNFEKVKKARLEQLTDPEKISKTQKEMLLWLTDKLLKIIIISVIIIGPIFLIIALYFAYYYP